MAQRKRGGTRGGRDQFRWDDVKGDTARQIYKQKVQQTLWELETAHCPDIFK